MRIIIGDANLGYLIMTQLQEDNHFKKHEPVIKRVLLFGGIIFLLGWWLRIWGASRVATFLSANFTHILAHIFIYALLGSLVLLIAPYLLYRPKIYLVASLPLLVLPRLLQFFTTDSALLQIFDPISLLTDLLGAALAFFVFRRLMLKLVVPLFESVSDMTDLAMMQYSAKAVEQEHGDVSLLFTSEITDVSDILETLALLATGVSLQSISQIKKFEMETVLEWLKTANAYRLIIESYLISKYKLTSQQLENMWSFLKRH